MHGNAYSVLRPMQSARPWLGLVFRSSTIDSSIILRFNYLIASHKQFRGVLGGSLPPVLAFSLRVLGLVSQEYDVLLFSV